MVQINFAKGEVQCKIVFYGPACSGKTENLRAIHERSPEGVRGQLTTIATDTNRTLFFDFLPLVLGDVAGIKTKVQLYAIPYKEQQNALRVLVLQGVDGVVFVADSAASHVENKKALHNLRDNLAGLGRELSEIPLVFQWNKTDQPNCHPAGDLENALNPEGFPSFAAVATTGEGVFRTLKSVIQAVLANVATMMPARPAASASAPVAQRVAPPVEEPAPAQAPAFVSAPEPEFVPEPEPEFASEPEPEPQPVSAPSAGFEDVDLPPEFPEDEPSTSFVPPWRQRGPESPEVLSSTDSVVAELGLEPAADEPAPEPEPDAAVEDPTPAFSTTTSFEPIDIDEIEVHTDSFTMGRPSRAWAPNLPVPAEPDQSSWDETPRARAAPASAPRRSTNPGGWANIDAHGRRGGGTKPWRDARPVTERRKQPRAEELNQDLPLTDLVSGSLVAFGCLVLIGLLVHKLL